MENKLKNNNYTYKILAFYFALNSNPVFVVSIAIKRWGYILNTIIINKARKSWVSQQETTVITDCVVTAVQDRKETFLFTEANSQQLIPHLALFSQLAAPCKPQQPDASKRKQKGKITPAWCSKGNWMQSIRFCAKVLFWLSSLHKHFGNMVLLVEEEGGDANEKIACFCFYCLAGMTITPMRRNNEWGTGGGWPGGGTGLVCMWEMRGKWRRKRMYVRDTKWDVSVW